MSRSLVLFLALVGCVGGDGAKTGDDTAPANADGDGDGYAGEADCDDASSAIHPGAGELCDGLDNDCDGTVDDSPTDGVAGYADADGDTYGDDTLVTYACTAQAGTVTRGGDCDDTDPAFHPGADEPDCTDPVDYNCDGSTGYADGDADGWAACTECDDGAAAVNPTATEACNGVDDDCDDGIDEPGATGEATWYADADGDGYGDPTLAASACDAPAGYVADDTDCDDADAAINPATVWQRDADGDGYGGTTDTVTRCEAPMGYVVGSDDCDDDDDAVHPGATEICDGAAVDEDCDGAVDDDDTSLDSTTVYAWLADADGDGYGADDTAAVYRCAAPSGTAVTTGGDCADGDAAVNPAATEVCDAANTDEDCDGAADDADSAATGKSTFYTDADADGYGATATRACDLAAGSSVSAGDCDDTSAAVRPGAVQVCDSANADEDCDGAADDADTSTSPASRSTFYRDADGDAYGAAGTTTRQCDVPAGYVTNLTDCDDTAATISPAGAEVCDGANTDEDCDGLADDDDTSAASGGKITTYADGDRDGYGDPSVAAARCDTTAAWVTDYADCDDTRGGVNPGVTAESCATGYDDDCDGATNEVGATACVDYYVDADGDSYGGGTGVCECAASGSHTVTTAGDCDDTAASIRPGATEVCDGVDQDCDLVADDGLTLYYADADSDGYGDDAAAGSCTRFSGSVTNGLDCDDADVAANPGETEVCDGTGTDEDCDGYVNDDDASVTGTTDWWVDADLDGYGDDAASAFAACDEPSGYVDEHTDCDDTDADMNPAADERYGDSSDDNCDGVTTPTVPACVGYNVPGDYATLSAAVTAGATPICLGAGSFAGNVALPAGITIQGQGQGVTSISGYLGGSTYLNTSADYVSYLSVTGGIRNWAGSIEHVTVSGCGTYAAIHLHGGTTIDSVSVSGTCSYGAILSETYGTVTIENSYIHDSTTGVYAQVSSGGVYVYNSVLEDNTTAIDFDDYGASTSYRSLYAWNNIIVNNTTGIRNDFGTSTHNTTSFGYNLLYGNTSNYAGTGTAASGTGYVTSDPLLDDSYTPPRLGAGSPAIHAGSGTHLPSTDYWGDTRSTTQPSMGPVEP
jgi:hypothetical protein